MTLYHGDCLDILPTLPAQSVDAVICDPPYGTTACKWDSVIPFEPMWRELKRIIKPRGAIVLFGSQPFTSALVMSNLEWFRYGWVWRKQRGTGHLNAHKQPMRDAEDIPVFYEQLGTFNPQMRDGAAYTRPSGNGSKNYGAQIKVVTQREGRMPLTTLEFDIVPRPQHPTEKPVLLLEYLIRTYTNEGDTVLDFAAGSGTTAVAAINTGRKFIAIEKERSYFDIAERRISDAQAALVQLELVA